MEPPSTYHPPVNLPWDVFKLTVAVALVRLFSTLLPFTKQTSELEWTDVSVEAARSTRLVSRHRSSCIAHPR
jgi:hypothetical protein